MTKPFLGDKTAYQRLLEPLSRAVVHGKDHQLPLRKSGPFKNIKHNCAGACNVDGLLNMPGDELMKSLGEYHLDPGYKMRLGQMSEATWEDNRSSTAKLKRKESATICIKTKKKRKNILKQTRWLSAKELIQCLLCKLKTTQE